ncbi:MAG: hypothetical protein CGW95_02210 [Phenylobacterium zucineum]|nr:MAG: hypothetical protein CGW95_02210 [Phenylobacterium zucineum]
MHRIFVPCAEFDRLDYWLHHPRSVEDLHAMGDDLAAGVRIMLYNPAGEDRPARLRFQEEINCWVAYPTPGIVG